MNTLSQHVQVRGQEGSDGENLQRTTGGENGGKDSTGMENQTVFRSQWSISGVLSMSQKTVA